MQPKVDSAQPLANEYELEMGALCVVEMEKKQTTIHQPTALDKIDRKQPKTFAFDHCFCSVDPANDNFASQEVVFNHLGRDILDNAFQGYNACIFAYGQTDICQDARNKTVVKLVTPQNAIFLWTFAGHRRTHFFVTFAWDPCKSSHLLGIQANVMIYLRRGSTPKFLAYAMVIIMVWLASSGKSYTMMGSQDNKGIIPRLCDALFGQIAKQQSSQLTYKVEVSYMEIYNEKGWASMTVCTVSTARLHELYNLHSLEKPRQVNSIMYLSRLLKGQFNSSLKVSIPLIKNSDENLCINNEEVANTFSETFFAAYTSEPNTPLPILNPLTRTHESIENVQATPRLVHFYRAFDKVPLKRLLYKLEHFGVRGKLLTWISNFLCDRQFTVRVGVVYSNKKNVVSGVPQGSVLGTILFLVYVCDLACGYFCSTFSYADDMKLFSSPSPAIQHDLDLIAERSSSWLLPLNQLKCCVLHLLKNNPRNDYTIDGVNIMKVAQESDLGQDINRLEAVQRRATKLPSGFKKPYEVRLRRLNLTTLADRRQHGDLITTYRILHNVMHCPGDIFEINVDPRLRGHQLKLRKEQFHSRYRQYFLPNRVFDLWNSVPNDVVMAPSINSFKNKLDHFLDHRR
ncbi:hypothetical protein NQ315_015100 [Exocentrus adspersus]|uniref:Kinesin motor domain-containing protein n=1 Tax=Exocentrus adspersus TaxID=1586481 RepID=A0AAV8VX90_9CUCU|nr:hypothetical protein NQ315_015100 [Exocentrus adspersus]